MPTTPRARKAVKPISVKQQINSAIAEAFREIGNGGTYATDIKPFRSDFLLIASRLTKPRKKK